MIENILSFNNIPDANEKKMKDRYIICLKLLNLIVKLSHVKKF